MEQKFIVPSKRDKQQAMSWLAGILILLGILLVYSKTLESRFSEISDLSPLYLETATVKFVVYALLSVYIFRITRAVQITRRYPPPNSPVFFKTRIRTSEGYIRTTIFLGYFSAGLSALIGTTGFYAWYMVSKLT